MIDGNFQGVCKRPFTIAALPSVVLNLFEESHPYSSGSNPRRELRPVTTKVGLAYQLFRCAPAAFLASFNQMKRWYDDCGSASAETLPKKITTRTATDNCNRSQHCEKSSSQIAVVNTSATLGPSAQQARPPVNLFFSAFALAQPRGNFTYRSCSAEYSKFTERHTFHAKWVAPLASAASCVSIAECGNADHCNASACALALPKDSFISATDRWSQGYKPAELLSSDIGSLTSTDLVFGLTSAVRFIATDQATTVHLDFIAALALANPNGPALNCVESQDKQGAESFTCKVYNWTSHAVRPPVADGTGEACESVPALSRPLIFYHKSSPAAEDQG